MFAAAAAVTANASPDLLGYEAEPSNSPNEKLGVAVVGVRGRGGSHIGAFAGRRDTEILYLCDADSEVGRKRTHEVAKRQSRRPTFCEDLRHALEDKRVDVVSIATPNHLHALQAIWSMQAGKDVYVEKPASHNVSEGRRMVEAARKYHRLCQVGMQCRSNPGMIAAMKCLHDGKLGSVNLARGLCYKTQPSAGRAASSVPPHNLNYDLWLGPASVQPVARKQFHHAWRWQWEFGNGVLGSQGLHQMDIASWGLNLQRLSQRVLSYGGRFGFNDSGDTANTQVVLHDFGSQRLVFEVRGLKSHEYRRAKVGVIFECANGYLIMRSYDKGAAFDLDGNTVEEFGGSGDHFGNFLRAVRSRSFFDLHADVEIGHLSSALVHLGNISYRLGGTAGQLETEDAVATFSPEEVGTLDRTLAHLKSHDVDLSRCPLRVGATLDFEPESESFVGNERANAMLTRSYRPPYVVPEAGQV